MINFNKFYKLFNLISLSLVVVSVLLLFFKGLNFGVDFKGGTLIELRSNDKNINVTSLRQSFNKMNLGDFNVKKFGNENDFLIKIEKKDRSANSIEIIKKNLSDNVSSSFNFRSFGYGLTCGIEIIVSKSFSIQVQLDVSNVFNTLTPNEGFLVYEDNKPMISGGIGFNFLNSNSFLSIVKLVEFP